MFDFPPVQNAAFGDLLTGLATWVLLGCAAWFAALGVAALLEAATGGRWPVTTWLGCPRPVRRVLLGGLGVALAAAPTPALAVGTAPEPPGSVPELGLSELGLSELGLPVPARTVGPDASHRAARRVQVRAGDCLWDLVRARLPPGTPAAEVAAVVEATHRRNRGVIGDDPDLLRPGQHLVLPQTVPPPRPEETP